MLPRALGKLFQLYLEWYSMEKSPFKGTKGVKRVINATGYSMAGLKTAFQNEAAFRSLLLIAIILIPTAFFLPVSPVERALMVAVCFLSLIIELFNSAIEAVVDRISLERHELSKNAKDLGSAAQFLGLWLIVFVWGIILLSRYL